ncbi:uncharacterized protein DUF4123 [Serratia fonticola]|uniref:Uncharacterized protein DUF4123 n=1 Tax=Serratia fonticola TaxID=47917 RepID=A0A559SZP6_SERFO|nr:DUF4123 domain-containing protein [Serratia fonticola]TQI79679.1 uncharacterized protein DUF4123 [Serratia fonticola]TQI98295.1 uncharacterized protein DUF4123 [Serratia fonticola]TVZ67823.1 uncharacterized protein DUF4123 [Serratia fonticola]
MNQPVPAQPEAHYFAKPDLGETLEYAIVDAGVEPALFDMLEQFTPLASCLYAEPLQPEIAQLAPYLILLTPAVKSWLENNPTPWGLLFTSAADMKTVRQHLRKYLQIKIPVEAKPVFFRYYDPRNFWTFLSALEAWQQHLFLGPLLSVTTYYPSRRQQDFSTLHHQYPSNIKLYKKLFELSPEQYQFLCHQEQEKYLVALCHQAQQWRQQAEQAQQQNDTQRYDVPFDPGLLPQTFSDLTPDTQALERDWQRAIRDLYAFCQQQNITDHRSVYGLTYLFCQQPIASLDAWPDSWYQQLSDLRLPGYFRAESLLLEQLGYLPTTE